ncbi:type II secretion system F family protein [Paenibacillus sp. Leaf72]|uniref:type II secretion system F family protein n=1 Tax=Paenibacillus sp. Leaf72 TaxID=1736234 RepID=UPI001F2F0BB9|nr:type II secretion system F family protein [Paenibacillus sp. Leaf72]
MPGNARKDEKTKKTKKTKKAEKAKKAKNTGKVGQSLLTRVLFWCGLELESGKGEEGNGSNASRQPAKTGYLTNYDRYVLSYREFAVVAIIGYAAVFTALYTVYHSLLVCLIAAGLGLCAPRYYKASLISRRKERLKLQFKEALYSLTSCLAAGRSVENAFIATLDDLQLLYPDPRTELLLEFQIVKHRLEHAEPLEQALRSLAARSHVEDIVQFVDVFAACKRSGGDLVEVMKRTAQTIGEKLEIQQDIMVLLAQKRFEARIMMAIPFIFLGFLNLMAPDYMAPLYGGMGYLLLTIGLGALLVCFWSIHKIMSIRV